LPEIALRIWHKATAPANLVYPSRKAARKIAAPLARIKTDLIKCTELPSELPKRVRIEA
jgi:hypothetical protein